MTAARVLVLLLGTLMLCDQILAQRTRRPPARKFEPGDEIEYLWVSKWYPGRVISADASGVAIEYKPMGGRGGSQRVTVTPYFSTIKVMHGGTVAWLQGGGSGAPSIMFLNKGESAQARANEMQKPYPGLFRDVDVPEKIFDPAKKKGLGTSLISSRGLTPQ